MSKVFDRLFFCGPTSLGDSYIANGIVHHFADQCHELHLPVFPHFYKTLSCLYQDFPNIKVVPMFPHELGEDQYVQENHLSRILRNSLYTANVNGQNLSIDFDLQTYDFYNLPFSLRYTNFRFPKKVDGSDELFDCLYKGRPYALIHRRTSHHPNGIPIEIHGFRMSHGLPELDYIEVDESLDDKNMLKWIKLIENASEIHCVSSSFWALVDSILPRVTANLFFHDVRAFSLTRVNCEWNNARWCIVGYGNKI